MGEASCVQISLSKGGSGGIGVKITGCSAVPEGRCDSRLRFIASFRDQGKSERPVGTSDNLSPLVAEATFSIVGILRAGENSVKV